MESLENLEQNYKRNGLSAFKEFASNMGITVHAQPQRPEANIEQLMANIDYFITYEVPALRGYKLDVNRLKTAQEASSIVIYLLAVAIHEAFSLTSMQQH